MRPAPDAASRGNLVARVADAPALWVAFAVYCVSWTLPTVIARRESARQTRAELEPRRDDEGDGMRDAWTHETAGGYRRSARRAIAAADPRRLRRRAGRRARRPRHDGVDPVARRRRHGRRARRLDVARRQRLRRARPLPGEQLGDRRRPRGRVGRDCAIGEVAGEFPEVVNAAKDGGTVADALARVDDVVAAQPDLVLLLLGGNDVCGGKLDDMTSAEDYRTSYAAILEQAERRDRRA